MLRVIKKKSWQILTAVATLHWNPVELWLIQHTNGLHEHIAFHAKMRLAREQKDVTGTQCRQDAWTMAAVQHTSDATDGVRRSSAPFGRRLKEDLFHG